MQNNNGRFRTMVDPFTMVSNSVIEDRSLSLKAKGLYLIIKHYITIPNFTLNKNYLISLSKEGERAFNSTWKELKDRGYLKQYRLKGKDGKWIYEYELLHDPVVDSEDTEIDKVNEEDIKTDEAEDKVKEFNKSVKDAQNKKASPMAVEEANQINKNSDLNFNHDNIVPQNAEERNKKLLENEKTENKERCNEKLSRNENVKKDYFAMAYDRCLREFKGFEGFDGLKKDLCISTMLRKIALE